MTKKIISVILVALLLIIALFMALHLALDLLGIVRAVAQGENTVEEFHYFSQGHYLHQNSIYYSSDIMLNQNLISNQLYFQNVTVCFIATTLSILLNIVNDASVMLGFISLALILLSLAISKAGNKVKTVGKLILVASLLGIFASNLVLGVIDSASWIRTVIWSLEQTEMNSLGAILSYVGAFIRYNLWKTDNYIYALAALAGGAYALSTVLSKKSSFSNKSKNEKLLAKLEKKHEELKRQLESSEA